MARVQKHFFVLIFFGSFLYQDKKEQALKGPPPLEINYELRYHRKAFDALSEPCGQPCDEYLY
jgi:hypothetical protein